MKYKFLRLENNKIVSEHHKENEPKFIWQIGKWYKEEKLDMCNSGFHCSSKILDAMSYVKEEILAEVETQGKFESQSDKEVWQEMKIVKAYRWTKKDSIALAIFSAESVLKNYEKLYPNDKRPRLAIEAAKKVLENDTKENRSAARSAESAAWSAAEKINKKINKWLVKHLKDMEVYV